MKCDNTIDTIHKDTVIIGNGPSGIALSYMLAGNIPYVTGTSHPDELLAIRLETAVGKSLLSANLPFLANGLEGRTTNPVSLLLDSLAHPCADIGLEMEPLIEWRRNGQTFEKFGHACEIQSGSRTAAHLQSKYFFRRWFERIRMINETNQRSYSFLRSQKKIENEYRKMLDYPWIIHPFSDFRKYWEVVICVMLMCQFLMIPLEFAFYNVNVEYNMVRSDGFRYMRYTTDIISFLDIIVSFFCGYCDEKQTVVILNPYKIASYYLRYAFVLDLFSSIPFDMILLEHEYMVTSREVEKLFFVGHYIGILKLLRFYWFVIYTARMFEATMNELYYVIHRLSVAIIAFVLYLHIICCYCLGWTSFQQPFDVRFAETHGMIKCFGSGVYTIGDLYVRFFHSGCLMVLNAGFGFAAYSRETIIFTTNVWVCSRILYILAIAYFIQLHSAVHSSHQKYVDMLCEVKDYMRHRQISNFLQKRILSYYDIKFQSCFFQESEILNTVSGQLRQEIIMNTCRKLVEDVSFFKNLPLSLLVRIVSSLTYDIFLTNDVITKVGTVGDCMYFIYNGTVAIYSANGKEIDHIVLGKGPPGGSWHTMDPDILTLSLGAWMSLPGMKYESRNSSEKRATARSVADYYVRYVERMRLADYFRSNVLVTKIEPYAPTTAGSGNGNGRWVEKVNNDICHKIRLCSRPERKDLQRSKSYISNAFNYIMNRGGGGGGGQERCAKRSWELNENQPDGGGGGGSGNMCSVRKKRDKDRSISLSTPYELADCDTCDEHSTSRTTPAVPTKWVVETVDLTTKACVRYTCANLVLANGSSDLPNKLHFSQYKTDPYWLLHDLRSLEIELDLHLQAVAQPEPVLVVGAGLSAADAIIATKARNVPVVHLFRNRTDLTKQLPENMYPEYHKVHQMMKDGTNYPLYTSLAEHTLSSLDESTHRATITSKEGKSFDLPVSYVVVLIGSRPDLSFLPPDYSLGVKKHMPIDSKKNTINIDKFTHQVHGHDGLYAIGPLAGDNFVRFLPGGALAVLSDLYKQHKH